MIEQRNELAARPTTKYKLMWLVHRICTVERGVSMGIQEVEQWYAQPWIFGDYLALDPVVVSPLGTEGGFAVQEATIELDRGETSLAISVHESGDLDNDPFAREVLKQAYTIFSGHRHIDCLRGVAFGTFETKLAPPAFPKVDLM